jgi:hypothetical protein
MHRVGIVSSPNARLISIPPFHNDVLAAVRYLKTQGVKTVSVVGASFDGEASGDASIKSVPGEIDRIVILVAAPYLPAEKLKSRSVHRTCPLAVNQPR